MLFAYTHKMIASFCFCVCSVFAGCQIPYPKREFLTEEEPDDKGDKVGIYLKVKMREIHLGGVFC